MEVADNGSTTIKSPNAVYTDSGAVKGSGYASTHLNVTHHFADNTTGFGEFQIRGESVNGLADVEHVPYDINKGKIKAENAKYAGVYSTIKNLTDGSRALYSVYSNDYYEYSALADLGVNIDKPEMPGTMTFIDGYKGGAELSGFEKYLLSIEGLVRNFVFSI